MTQILISGAGLAGPALAYWLHRHGCTVTVVERAPRLRTGGYKVDVRGAGVEVLKRMGVYGQAAAADTGMRHVTYVNPAGRPVAVLDANLLMGRRGDDIEVMRTDLTGILHAATASDVEYVFGDAITGLTDGADGVDVTFERGAPRRFDLVIGADGLHSATRRLAFGDVPLTHLGAYIGFCTVPNHLGLDHEEVFWTRPGRTIFLYASAPDAPARAGLAFASPVLPRGRAGARELVAQRYAGDGWEVPRILDAVRGSDDFYFDSMSQVELPSWSAGRVALAGDAAHCPSPASGQGTSLALVGAYVLAEELSRAGHRTAFAAYERRMRPYVAKNLAFGRRMAGDMVPGSRFAITVRNYGMRTLKYNPRREQLMDRVLGPMLEAANAIAI